MQYAGPIDNLIKALTKLPGIGEKSATRLALFVLNSKREYVEGLCSSLIDVKEKVRLCSRCMAFSDVDPCGICADARRDASLVCVVSDYRDFFAIEGTGAFKGVYHILHGNLAPLKGIGPDELRIRELIQRLKSPDIREVIVATGFDAEGEATAMYLTGIIRQFSIRLTRIASGVPVGSYIEYMDDATLSRAMEGRMTL
ncbi:MAG: recombination mediator RecR [Deltaproteobacteria bacterium]